MSWPVLLQQLLHFDQYLVPWVQQYGPWIYLGLFLILFAETGLVVTPILPGDSMLFVCGTLAGAGLMSLSALLSSLITAAVLGDGLNYYLGRRYGVRLFGGRWLRREYLQRTEAFYERHGGKAVVIGRFLPIIRTFVPFVAGIARMPYARFLRFNLFGAVLWVGGLVLAGYFLGAVPWVKSHLNLVLVALILLSLLPAAWTGVQGRLSRAID
ncbi:VTT domain-containing protein [Acidithiobacillus sp.]|uniref:VTT domain-containing protein n=1 Tax=Acidithiobacillus sp. TaxID=1872118 RepID=UPI0025BC9B29|nr:VTT domain-containing protein [Acidithiobacillus sp.]